MNSNLLIPTGLLSFATLTGIAWAGEDVDQLLAVDPNGIIRIINPRGDLDIRGWDRPEVQVEGEVDDLADRIVFKVTDKYTLIQVVVPKKHANWGDGSDLTIYVPKNSKLKIEAVSSEVDIQGVVGVMAIRTVSGDIEVTGVGSRTHINTVSGDVEVNDGVGMLKATTLSGDLDIRMEATDISVNTMSGNVELELGEFKTLIAHSVNSSIQLTGRLAQNGRISAQSVNGDIELELIGPVNATVKVRTGAGGEIDNDLTDDEPVRRKSRYLILNSTVGDGSATINLHSVNGDIDLDRAD